MTALPPIRRQVVVPGTRDAAFAVFTGEIGLWWPIGRLSVYGAGGTVAFEDGRLVERGPGGGEAVWGTVLEWDPPAALAVTWHPGSDVDKASRVRVRFEEVADDLTLVTLEHDGWERLPDPGAARREYGNGWPLVLDGYAARPSGAAAPEGPVWLVLSHTAGPALPAGEPVFGQPDFAEHIAFVRRLRERGVLVAAGSLDRVSTGMTVIRVPDPADVAAYVRLAQYDDQAVARGLLMVEVRPWHVALER
ncbi:SRPBCC domain-containing protein [Phytohabitans sp. ZYX-F-186]|uniref:SRPBCC domain-containing protein n=1 Tax=Phytohabitans maris TaxID=3071409 RepID=A0ABU0ZFG5_9ACTN|nr:SRPBCC domain-containing protein [Phytohabitans sp. ZYX-F-186]MDQ7905087.1 SRPBCC domain-containing protein [Phytohabitans sp. ZYX-F-186]